MIPLPARQATPRSGRPPRAIPGRSASHRKPVSRALIRKPSRSLASSATLPREGNARPAWGASPLSLRQLLGDLVQADLGARGVLVASRGAGDPDRTD